MTPIDILYCLIYIAAVFAFVIPLGRYIAKVMDGGYVFTSPAIRPVERLIYKLCGIGEQDEMDWKEYSLAVFIFSFVSFVLLYTILRLQGVLPFNPTGQAGFTPDLAFNTAISFITNTNWQSYAGENASYFSQSIGLVIQNFFSAAVGMSVMFALLRGVSRKETDKIGNFWVDTIRGTLYVLIPASLLLSVFLVSQGVVQTYSAPVKAELVEKVKGADGKEVTEQNILLGPVASQEAIKQIGTNGGGFFNANAAHPLENPSPLTNFVLMVAIMMIPAALCYSFGIALGDVRQGWVMLGVKSLVFIPLMFFACAQEAHNNPHLESIVKAELKADLVGGNMEGKETRFGIAPSALWASATTSTSSGSSNSSHDSFSPLGGMVPMVFMKFGEVIFGGIGSGLYVMITYVIISVFIAGQMVGRTPEYFGKKLGAFEVKMASLLSLVPAAFSLIGVAIAVMVEPGKAAALNSGAHGFSEITYAFASASNNNGSAFAGISANNVFYNTVLGICMFAGRFFMIVPVLAIAGSLAAKKKTPTTVGTLNTNTLLFAGLLAGVVVMVGFLNYIPAVVLGPIAEHMMVFGATK